MKQFGDITKLNGAELDPVDLIVGGSPCQDLSVAGKRAGLDGERSGLFMEMVRLIKEMRNATNGLYPRFALWENVPGAFSSNNGRDFQAVLTEFTRIIEPTAPDVPMPEEGWPKSGVLLVSDWSVAWRTHDAQFWGVAQRRRRLSLVADFRGTLAPKLLFEEIYPVSESVSGNIEPGESAGEDPAEAVEDSAGANREGNALIVQNDQGGVQMDVTYGTAMTLRSQSHGHEPIVFDEMSIYKSSSFGNYSEGIGSLRAHGGDMGDGAENIVVGALCADDYKGANRQYVDDRKLQVTDQYVRRLTPLECERLQGFPDGWTDIPGATDAKRYRALGNSIALPFWEHLAKRLVNIGGVQTIGSLFDGIGGFPLCFQRAGAETLWTSEIEPFCEQVVKIRFGGEA